MILSAQDLAARLSNPKNSKRVLAGNVPHGSRTVEDLDRNDKPAGPDLYIRDSGQGKRPGDKELPEELKIPVTLLAKLGGNQTEISKTFGVSDSLVSALKNDKASLEDESKEIVERSLEAIRETVVDKLNATLNHLTPDKTLNANAKDVASVARSMASVLKDISPDKDKGNGSRVQVVIHSVAQKDVSHYEVIEVNT